MSSNYPLDNIKSTRNWFCHCCSAENDAFLEKCCVCGRVCTYATSDYLPLHGDAQNYLRTNQIDTIFPDNAIHDANGSRWTALHHVCYSRNVELAQCLIEKGALVDAVTEHGMSPLHLACYSGSMEMVSLLITHKADVNALTRYELNSPLHIAIEQNWRPIVQYLIDIGARVNIVNAVGRSPLHVAAAVGRVDIGQYLLFHGADHRLTDVHGWNPQMVAEFHSHRDFVELLVRAGMKENQSKFYELPKNSWDSDLWNEIVKSRQSKVNHVKKLERQDSQVLSRMSSLSSAYSSRVQSPSITMSMSRYMTSPTLVTREEVGMKNTSNKHATSNVNTLKVKSDLSLAGSNSLLKL